eukprot:TRINITY_DN93381_c0_g1_i1.p1 TRINITY_DN93381_c0_g1~~TRINITY_DN93381_c0_g1_i1.p1  ORF type:complete len:139 (-),score=26.87 TRINITY_DN93381_c0_g1_i1:286-702(-)
MKQMSEATKAKGEIPETNMKLMAKISDLQGERLSMEEDMKKVREDLKKEKDEVAKLKKSVNFYQATIPETLLRMGELRHDLDEALEELRKEEKEHKETALKCAEAEKKAAELRCPYHVQKWCLQVTWSIELFVSSQIN